MAPVKGHPSKLWDRAVKRLDAARRDLEALDSDGAANRAYYAAFHAVSALFAAEGLYFTRHFELQQAIDRHFIGNGRWDRETYVSFVNLSRDRKLADYGGDESVSMEDAAEAVRDAVLILDAVHRAKPELFPFQIGLNFKK